MTNGANGIDDELVQRVLDAIKPALPGIIHAILPELSTGGPPPGSSIQQLADSLQARVDAILGSEPSVGPATVLRDDVDPGEIHWIRSPEAAQWPIVTDLEVEFKSDQLIFHHDAVWPRTVNISGKALAGNCWVGTRGPGGKWQLCPFEWFRVGQKDRRKGAATEPGHLLDGTRPPTVGADVLFMVSTPGRGHHRTDNQRSRIIRVKWQ